MKKILMMLILCVAIIFQTTGVFSYEVTPYVGDGIITASSVSVKYEKQIDEDTFETVSAISEATKITACCNVKVGSDFANSGENSVSVRIVAVLYKDGCLENYSVSDAATITLTDKNPKHLSAEIDKSLIPEADELRVFIWDNVENARPLINNKNHGTEVLVAGELVEFDSNNHASVEVDAGYVTWPDVIVLTDNFIADVDVDLKGAFPLSKPTRSFIESNVEVDGTSEKGIITINVKNVEYTIEVTQAVPQITEVQFYHWDKIQSNALTGAPADYYTNSQLKIYYDIFEPEYTTTFPGPHKVAIEGTEYEDIYKAEAKANMDVVPVFTNRAGTGTDTLFLWCDITPELLGSQYFCMPYGTYSGQTNSANLGLGSYTFTIDRSARIYMQCSSPEILDSGWKLAVNRFQSTETKQKNNAYVLSMASTVYYGNGYTNSMYYKDYDVNPGEKCTITLPAEKQRPVIFVKYKDSKYVANASYTLNGTKTPTTTQYVAKPVYADNDAASDKYKIFTDGGTATTSVKNNGNLIYSTSTFLDDGSTNRRQYSLVGVPDELVGAEALLLPFNATNMTQVDFEINTSSRVYVFTNGSGLGNMLGDGWENTNFDYTGTEFDGNDIAVAYRSSDTGFNNTVTNAKSYYCDYIVNPGETLQVSLKNLNLPGYKVIIIVKPLNE